MISNIENYVIKNELLEGERKKLTLFRLFLIFIYSLLFLFWTIAAKLNRCFDISRIAIVILRFWIVK